MESAILRAATERAMNVKEVVRTAITYVEDLFEQVELTNLGLEEVIYDPELSEWDVTVGFSRPWDYPKQNVMVTLAGLENQPKRDYKVIKISDSDGHVRSVMNRQ